MRLRDLAAATALTVVLLVLLVVIPPAFVAIVPLLFVVWIVAIGQLFYQRLNVKYRLTSQRFFHERGILSRSTNRIDVIDMDDITVEQNLVDRILGLGTILIASSDRTDPLLRLRGIRDVKQVSAKFDEARRAERIRRGLHIEQV